MFILVSIAAIAVATAAPTAVVEKPAQVSAMAAPQMQKPSDDDKVTCRVDEETGSLFPARTCRTNAQWREMTRSAREMLDAGAHGAKPAVGN